MLPHLQKDYVQIERVTLHLASYRPQRTSVWISHFSSGSPNPKNLNHVSKTPDVGAGHHIWATANTSLTKGPLRGGHRGRGLGFRA